MLSINEEETRVSGSGATSGPNFRFPFLFFFSFLTMLHIFLAFLLKNISNRFSFLFSLLNWRINQLNLDASIVHSSQLNHSIKRYQHLNRIPFLLTDAINRQFRLISPVQCGTEPRATFHQNSHSAVSVQFQCSFSAVSVQFQGSFSAVSGQFH